MEDIQKKKLLFNASIRKKYLNDKFKEIRQDVTVGREISQVWSNFMRNQPSEVPAICLSHEKYLTESMLQPFLTLLMNNELQLVHNDRNLSTWFFDCTAEVNLKFMTKVCKIIQNCSILIGFFNATVEVSKDFAQIFDKTSKHYPSKLDVDEQNQQQREKNISYLKSKEGSNMVTALLGFWEIFLSMSEGFLQTSNVVITIKSLQLFLEEADIYHQKQTFLFILCIFRMIKKLQILEHSSNHSIILKLKLRQASTYLIDNIKKKMPYMLNINSNSHLYYPELGLILIQFCYMNDNKPGIFFQVVCSSDYLKNYIFGLFNTQENSYQCKLTALKLVNSLDQYSLLSKALYLEGLLNITKIMAHRLLKDPLYVNATSIILYNLVNSDENFQLKTIFQLLDYKQLLSLLQSSVSEDVFINLSDLLVKILQVYPQNPLISPKIIEQGDLETLLRQFCRQRSEQIVYGYFVKVVMRNLDFFMREHRRTVLDMWHHADEMTFEGIEQFVLRVEDYEAMRLSNRTL